MKKLIGDIRQGVEVRPNLITLRQQLKQQEDPKVRKEILEESRELLAELLGHEDAKVRKNAALIIGELQAEELLEQLYQAYVKEETLFVRSDYLKAMSQLDFKKYQKDLEKRLDLLNGQEISEENQKHYREEITILQKMVMQHQTREKHTFTGLDRRFDVLLTTNRNYREVTARQIQGSRISLVPLGVKVREADIRQIMKIRTYKELLFLLDVQTLNANPEKAADELAGSDLLRLLERAHGTKDVFCFRITIAGKMPLDKRSVFIKRCSFALEQGTGRRLVNTPSDYEIELRLFERKDGTFLPLVKLHTLKVNRFAYRKESIAASIHPADAALIAELTRPYLKEHAQILDPFCGVGTMLLERDMAVKAGPMYGIDIFGEAIHKARENTKLAEREIYYINRDFFDFKHEYLFDEIFTNMPVRGKKTQQEQEELYHSFFVKAGEVLKKDGIMILYSNEKGYIKKQIRLSGTYKLLNEFCINEKEDFSIYVIGQRG